MLRTTSQVQLEAQCEEFWALYHELGDHEILDASDIDELCDSIDKMQKLIWSIRELSQE